MAFCHKFHALLLTLSMQLAGLARLMCPSSIQPQTLRRTILATLFEEEAAPMVMHNMVLVIFAATRIIANQIRQDEHLHMCTATAG